ncbi:amino acid ABC transporter permease [Arthrobacter sp. B1I2]|uniref:amino acid ABC transporter permease n=1 Tax=Arthrobacter sp. B1I2 TaxID=3042263 RepID=UPI0027877FA5|nr:amino acid ABC transporter permease [Arthrobacter sp. B1I2]MDQ0733453.1 polar amino acid transport system permease protein [Arthrobacter sp. B1I2]
MSNTDPSLVSSHVPTALTAGGPEATMRDSESSTPTDAASDVRLPHRQHPGWWLAIIAVLGLAAAGVNVAATNPNMQWDVFARYFFSGAILQGLGMTLWLTLIAMVAGTAIGVITAVMRQSPVKVLASAAWLYTWFFRGTPLLVQIIFWYNLAILFPTLELGIPFTGLTLWSGATNSLITPFVAASLALSLNEGAYMAEIVRGGLQSVDQGQEEAATALGMTRMKMLRRIVIPQAMRVIVPPFGNEVISMLKSSSLVSVIAMAELLYSAQLIYQQSYETIPLLMVASLWYLVLVTVLSAIQYYVERRFSRGSKRALPPTPAQRLTTWVRNTSLAGRRAGALGRGV